MCGIAGIWSQKIAWAELSAIQEMVKQLQHRGPDAMGLAEFPKMVLGHRRLSILDLSPAGNQPMFSEDGSVALIFNGEIYNFRELRQELEAGGAVFHSKSDTEVILKLYLKHGRDAVSKLEGMFAFAIWDENRGECLLARDRFGEKPLFYTEPGERFAFASEMGPLSLLPWLEREVDPEALSLFWQLHYIPAPWTCEKRIRKLPAGCIAIWNGRSLRIDRYYPQPVAPFSGSFADATRRFEELFFQSVGRSLVADVPVGLLLSAGLDSSSVAAAAAKFQALKTITVDFQGADSAQSEAAAAEQTARELKLPHRRVHPRLDLIAEAELLLRHFGEPFFDAAMFPASAVYQALRGECTVVLTGDGGDEALGGYRKYARWGWMRAAHRFGETSLASSLESTIAGWYSRKSEWRARLKGWLCGLRSTSVGASAHRVGRLVLTETRSDLQGIFRSDVTWWADAAPLGRLEETLNRIARGDAARAAMEKEMVDILPEKMLRKVDIASMVHSIESRAPFLNHRLVDFLRSLPTSYLWGGGQSKLLLRESFKRELRPEILRRGKTGFAYPLRETLDKQSRNLQERLREDVFLKSLVQPGAIDRIFTEHRLGTPWHTTLILKLLILSIWNAQRPGDPKPSSP